MHPGLLGASARAIPRRTKVRISEDKATPPSYATGGTGQRKTSVCAFCGAAEKIGYIRRLLLIFTPSSPPAEVHLGLGHLLPASTGRLIHGVFAGEAWTLSTQIH